LTDGVFVSPASAWEIGMLSKPRSGRPALHFLPDPKTWFARLMSGPAIKKAAITPEIAIDASYLPGELHADPAGRLIIATARYLDAPIVTRDAKIIAYAKAGFIKVIPC
jgi:PIN domain nuclease of toxin-antitoxin system